MLVNVSARRIMMKKTLLISVSVLTLLQSPAFASNVGNVGIPGEVASNELFKTRKMTCMTILPQLEKKMDEWYTGYQKLKNSGDFKSLLSNGNYEAAAEYMEATKQMEKSYPDVKELGSKFLDSLGNLQMIWDSSNLDKKTMLDSLKIQDRYTALTPKLATFSAYARTGVLN